MNKQQCKHIWFGLGRESRQNGQAGFILMVAWESLLHTKDCIDQNENTKTGGAHMEDC